jgi:hypothetical protein
MAKSAEPAPGGMADPHTPNYQPMTDFLRRLAANDKQPTDDQLEMASAAIRNSGDNAAESLCRADGDM